MHNFKHSYSTLIRFGVWMWPAVETMKACLLVDRFIGLAVPLWFKLLLHHPLSFAFTIYKGYSYSIYSSPSCYAFSDLNSSAVMIRKPLIALFTWICDWLRWNVLPPWGQATYAKLLLKDFHFQHLLRAQLPLSFHWLLVMSASSSRVSILDAEIIKFLRLARLASWVIIQYHFLLLHGR